jgi:hypothetical protein
MTARPAKKRAPMPYKKISGSMMLSINGFTPNKNVLEVPRVPCGHPDEKAARPVGPRLLGLPSGRPEGLPGRQQQTASERGPSSSGEAIGRDLGGLFVCRSLNSKANKYAVFPISGLYVCL